MGKPKECDDCGGTGLLHHECWCESGHIELAIEVQRLRKRLTRKPRASKLIHGLFEEKHAQLEETRLAIETIASLFARMPGKARRAKGGVAVVSAIRSALALRNEPAGVSAKRWRERRDA